MSRRRERLEFRIYSRLAELVDYLMTDAGEIPASAVHLDDIEEAVRDVLDCLEEHVGEL